MANLCSANRVKILSYTWAEEVVLLEFAMIQRTQGGLLEFTGLFTVGWPADFGRSWRSVGNWGFSLLVPCMFRHIEMNRLAEKSL